MARTIFIGKKEYFIQGASRKNPRVSVWIDNPGYYRTLDEGPTKIAVLQEFEKDKRLRKSNRRSEDDAST